MLLSSIAGGAGAQVTVTDTLTGGASSYAWQAFDGACLTAGTGTGTVPACTGLSYYGSSLQVGGVSGRLPDPVGQGALRLTNGDSVVGGTAANFQRGAVVSTQPFASNQGLMATFTSVSYGGNGGSGDYSTIPPQIHYSTTGTGADGISFFLADASQPLSLGGDGGALGYACANQNPNYDGVIGGYLGVGIDEYGNFANAYDITDTGPGFQPGRIALRGAGSTVFSVLSARYPSYYPASLSAAARSEAIHKTCSTGKLWDYSNAAAPVQTTRSLDHNYRFMGSADLPQGVVMSNQQGADMPKRGLANPISYGLNLTQDGLLSVTFSVNGGFPQTIINNASITASNGPIPPSFRFGFAAGSGAGSNIHEILCFKAGAAQTSSGSASLNQTSKIQIGTQVYLGAYNATNWWGSVTAQNIVQDASTRSVSINPVANWDAGCGLTGGLCSKTGGTSAVQAPSDRVILTYSAASSAGIPFQWASLDPAQQTRLTAGDPSATADRLNYLRGDRSKEVSNGGPFRTRTRVLGDVMNSSPTWVGYPQLPYTGPWRDALYPGTAAPEGTTYRGYMSTYATRTNVVYVGANDGLLHGVRAGAYDAGGKFNSAAPNDGRELIAYMPGAVLASIHSATPAFDYSSTRYAHTAHVDAPVGTGDLFYNGAWHTWIAGGLGGGGNPNGVVGDGSSVVPGAFYALDVTDPTRFSEANASSLVMADIASSSSQACSTGGAGCWSNLGGVSGAPLIRRLHNGSWAVIFGNGLNSASGVAGVYLMTVDPSGGRNFHFLSTGRGPVTDSNGTVTARNGIVNVGAADLDGDHVTDYLYAGDLFGNLWRFDLTSASPNSWGVRSSPIFSTGGAPITARPTIVAAPDDSGATRVVISFGTGRILPQTLTGPATPAPGVHALYGVWDADMSGWNALSSERYAIDPAGTSTITSGSLHPQSVTSSADSTGATAGTRSISSDPICWQGSTACASGNDRMGWKVNLPAPGEQIIYNPTISDGIFVVNTVTPSSEQILACTSQPQRGFTMAILPDTGGAPPRSYFQNYASSGPGVVAGLGFDGVGTPTFVSTGLGRFLITQTVSGTAAGTPVLNPGSAGRRLTWAKLR